MNFQAYSIKLRSNRVCSGKRPPPLLSRLQFCAEAAWCRHVLLLCTFMLCFPHCLRCQFTSLSVHSYRLGVCIDQVWVFSASFSELLHGEPRRAALGCVGFQQVTFSCPKIWSRIMLLSWLYYFTWLHCLHLCVLS